MHTLYITMLVVLVAGVAGLCERISRLRDKIHIYENPAQVQIYDAKDKQYTRAINCKILPCGKFTGRPRQCVVACHIERSDSLPKKILKREDLYHYPPLEVADETPQ